MIKCVPPSRHSTLAKETQADPLHQDDDPVPGVLVVVPSAPDQDSRMPSLLSLSTLPSIKDIDLMTNDPTLDVNTDTLPDVSQATPSTSTEVTRRSTRPTVGQRLQVSVVSHGEMIDGMSIHVGGGEWNVTSRSLRIVLPGYFLGSCVYI